MGCCLFVFQFALKKSKRKIVCIVRNYFSQLGGMKQKKRVVPFAPWKSIFSGEDRCFS